MDDSQAGSSSSGGAAALMHPAGGSGSASGSQGYPEDEYDSDYGEDDYEDDIPGKGLARILLVISSLTEMKESFLFLLFLSIPEVKSRLPPESVRMCLLT